MKQSMILSDQIQSLSCLSEKKDNFMPSNKYKNRVIIENIPSRTELYTMIDDFIDMYSILKSDYGVDNKSSVMEISFKQSDYMFKLLKFLKKVKSNNPVYSKLNTNFHIEGGDHENNNPSHSSNFHQSIDMTSSLNYTNQNNVSQKYHVLNTEGNERKPARNHSRPIPKSNRRLEILNINNPYVTEDDVRKKEYVRNKEKWIGKTDFVKYGGQNKVKLIPNFVNLDNFTNSPLNYKFREIKKDKWIAHNNFYV